MLNRNFDSKECDKRFYYQPIRFNTSHESECQLKQSSCNEEGQLVATGGTTITDKTCRCDHTLGYAFVSRPSASCYCKPSEEDCSCYKKECPIYQKLMAGKIILRSYNLSLSSYIIMKAPNFAQVQLLTNDFSCSRITRANIK